MPRKQPKRGRLWLNDGSCIRLRPQKKEHVWSYDFALARTTDGRPLRILAILDEYTRECLSLYVDRQISSQGVLDRLYNLFIHRGAPEHIRSDNGPEFTAKVVREWLGRLEVKTLFIEPGSPWENGYVESFIGKLRDKGINHVYIKPRRPRLNGKVERSHRIDEEEFYRMLKGVVIDDTNLYNEKLREWEDFYNYHRPHAALAGMTPYERFRERAGLQV